MGVAKLSKSLHRFSRKVRFGRRYGSMRFARLYDEGKSFQTSGETITAQIAQCHALKGAVVVDIGCGTGQMLDRVGAAVAEYHGFDTSDAMIRFARRRRTTDSEGTRVEFGVAHANSIPLADSCADLILFPWSLTSILGGGEAENWQATLESCLAEAERLASDAATIVILETLSLAHELPPGEIWHPGRREILHSLEGDHGFTRSLFENEWRFERWRNVRRYSGIWFDKHLFTDHSHRRGTTLIESCGSWCKRLAKRSL